MRLNRKSLFPATVHTSHLIHQSWAKRKAQRKVQTTAPNLHQKASEPIVNDLSQAAIGDELDVDESAMNTTNLSCWDDPGYEL